MSAPARTARAGSHHVPSSAPHHAAQRAIVRMLYDRAFAEAVYADPIAAGLAPEVARLVGGGDREGDGKGEGKGRGRGRGIDPRALRADALRVRRTLGTLIEELKASSLMALDERRSLALLEGFFSSPEFHRAIEEERALVLSYADFLERLCVEGTLSHPLLPDVIRLERMQARARREAAPVPHREEGSPPPPRLRLAPGVIFARLAPAALEVPRAVEQLLFEQSLVAGSGLAIDGPRLRLPRYDPDPAARLPVVAVPHGGGLSLVTLDEESTALMEPLAEAGTLAAGQLVKEAVRRGIERSRAEALLVELCDQEVLSAAPSGPAQ